MLKHELYMQRCIQLALRGKGKVAPNPMVGAVIVHEDRIIGEGYHEKFGEAHAEVNAINSVKDKSLLQEATIYVSLEPCAHFGKTPPCANLIIDSKIPKVVIGSKDPHSKVAGKGIEILKNNHIELTTGILEEECRAINKFFFTFHEKNRPYVLLKWAQTANGFMDDHFKRTQISCTESRSLVHQWRSEYQSILVGRATVETDDPILSVRHADGSDPIRIIIDPQLSLKTSYNVFNEQTKTIVFNTLKEEKGLIEFVRLNELSVERILSKLHEMNINSVLVEGGGKTLEKFVSSNLWDEAKVFISEKTFSAGTMAPVINRISPEKEQFFSDELLTYINK